MAGRDGQDEMRSFVESYRLESIPHIPDSDNNELWLSFGVRGQPAWVLVKADGSSEVGFGSIPDDVLAAAAGAPGA